MMLSVTDCLPRLILGVTACLLWIPTAVASQLSVTPEKLELTGHDSIQGVIVSLTDDNGKVTDVTRQASYD